MSSSVLVCDNCTEAEQVLAAYEASTTTKFVVTYVDKGFGNDGTYLLSRTCFYGICFILRCSVYFW